MAKVVVVKFRNSCKAYYFSGEGLRLEEGQGVIVDTAHGQEYAIVIDPEREVEELVAPLKTRSAACDGTGRCKYREKRSPSGRGNAYLQRENCGKGLGDEAHRL